MTTENTDTARNSSQVFGCACKRPGFSVRCWWRSFSGLFGQIDSEIDKLGVTGSSPVAPIRHKPLPNRSHEHLPAVGVMRILHRRRLNILQTRHNKSRRRTVRRKGLSAARHRLDLRAADL
jgi:hypothetical protein